MNYSSIGTQGRYLTEYLCHDSGKGEETDIVEQPARRVEKHIRDADFSRTNGDFV